MSGTETTYGIVTRVPGLAVLLGILREIHASNLEWRETPWERAWRIATTIVGHTLPEPFLGPAVECVEFSDGRILMVYSPFPHGSVMNELVILLITPTDRKPI